MVNIKNTDYIDAREIERIINDSWYNMPTTCDCGGNDIGIFLDTTKDQLIILKFDLKIEKSANHTGNIKMLQNEIKLIETPREAGYTDRILLLISY